MSLPISKIHATLHYRETHPTIIPVDSSAPSSTHSSPPFSCADSVFAAAAVSRAAGRQKQQPEQKEQQQGQQQQHAMQRNRYHDWARLKYTQVKALPDQNTSRNLVPAGRGGHRPASFKRTSNTPQHTRSKHPHTGQITDFHLMI